MPVELLHFDGVAWRGARRRSRRERRRVRLGRSADERRGRRSTTPFPAGSTTELHVRRRAVRRHARRPPRARRDLPHRLRLSRSRVLPPAARRRHADVPPRPPRRHRPAGRRRPARTSPAHVDFTARSPSPARTPGSTSLGYTSQARFLLNCGLGDAARRGPTVRERVAATRSSSTSTRWASCSRCSAFAKGAALRADRLCRRRPPPPPTRPQALRRPISRACAGNASTARTRCGQDRRADRRPGSGRAPPLRLAIAVESTPFASAAPRAAARAAGRAHRRSEAGRAHRTRRRAAARRSDRAGARRRSARAGERSPPRRTRRCGARCRARAPSPRRARGRRHRRAAAALSERTSATLRSSWRRWRWQDLGRRRALAEVVAEAGIADRERGREPCRHVEHHHQVHAGVDLGVIVGALRHAEQAIDLGHARAASAPQSRSTSNMREGLFSIKPRDDFLPDALGDERSRPRRWRPSSRISATVSAATLKVGEARGEPRDAQDAHRVLGERRRDVAQQPAARSRWPP